MLTVAWACCLVGAAFTVGVTLTLLRHIVPKGELIVACLFAAIFWPFVLWDIVFNRPRGLR